MLLEYIAIAMMIAVATLIAAVAIGLGELLGPKKRSKVKEEPYESGIVPIGPGTAEPTSPGVVVPIQDGARGSFADVAMVDPARDVTQASPVASSPATNDDVVRRLSELGAVQIDCVSLPGVAGRHLASCQVPLDPDGQLHRVFQSEGTGAAAATQRLLDDVTAWRRRMVVRAAAVPPPGQPVPSVDGTTN